MLQEMTVENFFLKMLHVIKILVLFSPEYKQLLHQGWLFRVYNSINIILYPVLYISHICIATQCTA
jgi:hypothetical protein